MMPKVLPARNTSRTRHKRAAVCDLELGQTDPRIRGEQGEFLKTWTIAAAAAALLAIACTAGTAPPTSQPASSPPPASQPTSALASITPSSAIAAEAEAQVAKGHVTDASGKPLAGAVANADWQLSDDYSLDGTTDANGDYRIALDPPNGSWHMSVVYKTTWNGVDYGFDLAPIDDSNFIGADGGVRDFVWKLTGPTPQGDSSYGGTVDVYMNFSGEIPIDPQYVKLTLTPDGPLVDGSTGGVVTATGDRIDDVAVGRYAVTAAYAEPGKPSVDLLVRVRNQGEFAPTVTAQFEQISVTGQQLELEVRSP
jgi:hypothetical protein